MAMPRDTLGECHIEIGHWQATFHGICVKHRQTYGIANTVTMSKRANDAGTHVLLRIVTAVDVWMARCCSRQFSPLIRAVPLLMPRQTCHTHDMIYLHIN